MTTTPAQYREADHSRLTASGPERRRHKRHAVSIEATLHRNGRHQAMLINDISAGGAGLESVVGVFANDAVEIELHNGRRISATVAWQMSGCCGLQFVEPLSETDPLLAGSQ